MANSVTMTYGAYTFQPVPLVSMQRNIRRAGGKILGTNLTLNLSGTLTSKDPMTPADSANFLDNMQEVEDLRAAFTDDCDLFEIKCDGTVVLSGYPMIGDLSFEESNNNWVQTVPFTLTLEFLETNELSESPEATKYIESYAETWNMEFVEDEKYFTQDLTAVTNQEAGYSYIDNDGNNPFEARVTHQISVQGLAACTGSGICVSAVDNARTFFDTIFSNGYEANTWGHAVSGISNLTNSDYDVFDHYRSHVVDETNGTIEGNETWLVLGTSGVSGTQGTRENFTVNYTKSLEDSRHRLSIEGQIQGFEQRDYSGVNMPTNTTTAAYTNASDAWSNVKTRLFPRAQLVFQNSASGTGPLNPEPVSQSVGHQQSKGIITYNYEFDNRPCSFISGSLTESINIVDNNPTDVFASLVVLGRQQGPILQSIGTSTSPTREVTFDVTMPTPTSCNFEDLDDFNPAEDVNTFLCYYESGLTGTWDDVFKSADNASWNPLTGRYSRTVGWTISKCSGNQPTSVCGSNGTYI